MKVKESTNGYKPSTYKITGLTQEELEFLRDLMGRFADNPGDGGIAKHFHTHLYCEIVDALGQGHRDYLRRFTFTASAGCTDGISLHCRHCD